MSFRYSSVTGLIYIVSQGVFITEKCALGDVKRQQYKLCVSVCLCDISAEASQYYQEEWHMQRDTVISQILVMYLQYIFTDIHYAKGFNI